jgi:predicted Fe-Mo cluster-binding NifX family protein
MRIAVASDDGVSISGHFGRCAGFVIFEIADQKAIRVEQRQNSGGHHGSQGDCTHPGHEHEHDRGHANHGHESFLMALQDCQAIICRGMGRRAIADLTARGIRPAIVTEDMPAHEAAEQYARGSLNASNDSTCCSH